MNINNFLSFAVVYCTIVYMYLYFHSGFYSMHS